MKEQSTTTGGANNTGRSPDDPSVGELFSGLARDTQEQRLLKEMQTDAVQQIVRRLQAAKKPA